MATALPLWPEDPDDWPMTSDKKFQLMCFRFNEPDTHPDNAASIEHVLDFVQNHGAKYSTNAAPALRLISPKDLQERIIWKYKELQKVLRTAKQLPPRTNNVLSSENVSVGSVEVDGVVVLTKSQRQS